MRKVHIANICHDFGARDDLDVELSRSPLIELVCIRLHCEGCQ